MVDVVDSGIFTTATFAPDGNPKYGTIETGGDVDMYRVFLPAGSYDINLIGDAIFGNRLNDPLLRVYDTSGHQLAIDDDDGTASNSYLDFTAPTSGTYLIAVGGFAGYTGDYALSMYGMYGDDNPDILIEPDSSITGRADSDYEENGYSIYLEAGVTYTFTLEGQAGVDGPNSDPIAPLGEKDFALISHTDGNLFETHSTGTITHTYTVPAGKSAYYYLGVHGYFHNDQGYYSLSVTSDAPLAAQRPSGTDRAVTVDEGGSYSGFSVSTFGYSDPHYLMERLIITSLPAQGVLWVNGAPVALYQNILPSQFASLIWYAPGDANGNNVASFGFEVVNAGPHDGTDQTPNTITFNVTPVNDAPVITSNSGALSATLNINENGAAVATIHADDVDSIPTYAVSGTDAALFDINTTTGALSFKSAPDYETPKDAGGDNVYNVTVLATDGSLADAQALAIVVHNIVGNTIIGTGGNNRVDASHAINSLAATGEEDTIDGRKGNDKLNGLGGNDTLVGGRGKDTLTGAAGYDRLDGGRDADQFVFATKLSSARVDTIVKFEHDADKLVLDNSVFKAIGTSLSSDEFYAKAGATAAHDKTDHLVYNKTTGDLYYDKDGKGGAAAVLFATLANHPGGLDHGDFLIV